MSSTHAVRVTLAGSAGGFGVVRTQDGDTVLDVKARACDKFTNWGVNETQVTISLVADGGDEPSAADIARALTPLGAGKSLAAAGIQSGAWLVLRRIGAFRAHPDCHRIVVGADACPNRCKTFTRAPFPC